MKDSEKHRLQLHTERLSSRESFPSEVIGFADLSSHEQQVCRLLAEGWGDDAVARLSGTDIITLRGLVYAIMGKLGVKDRVELAMLVRKQQ